MNETSRGAPEPRPSRTTRRAALLAGAASAVFAPLLRAHPRGTYPERPVSLIVPFPAGGTTDHLLRTLAQIAQADLGQALVVENRPGASTLIAAGTLARARPDGHTIGIVPLVLNRLRALGKTDLDVARDFGLIARIAGQSHGLVARSDSKLRNLDDVVAAARRSPGRITYGTSGVASHTHVAMEDFAARAGIEVRHIPYRGGLQSLTALRAGEVDLIAESALWGPDVDAGRCRLLSTWDEQRMARYPAVPTMNEMCYPVSIDGSIGLGGPRGMARSVQDKLQRVFRHAILSREFEAECDRWLAQVLYLDGDSFRAHAKANFMRETELVKRLGPKLSG
jgi:tripartite-type tricarboxylate transporter receptor subunit TctC